MKKWVLFLLLIIMAANVQAQFANAEADTAFKFTHRISRSVNHWIAFPKDKATGLHAFGYLYIDPNQGFIFNLEGFFTNNGNGTFTRNARKVDEATRQQYMLKPGPKPLVAIIEQDHDVELDIDPRPDWAGIYNDYADTVAHCIEWAKAYNKIKDPEMAVSILLDPYRSAPHTKGLEVELCHAYYDLKHFDDAIKVAETALLTDLGNPTLYKELGNAQLSKGRLDDAISTYTSGIKLCDPGKSDDKAEMAMYTAVAYGNKGNKEGYKKWIIYAKLWAPKESEISGVLDDL